MDALIIEKIKLIKCKHELINNCKNLSLKELLKYTDYLDNEIKKIDYTIKEFCKTL